MCLEVLAHPRPPQPHADATAGTGGEKGPHGARWLLLKHPKIPAKYVLDQRRSWDRSLQSHHGSPTL